MKNGDTNGALAVVGLVANILARVTILVHPVMPKTTTKIAAAL